MKLEWQREAAMKWAHGTGCPDTAFVISSVSPEGLAHFDRGAAPSKFQVYRSDQTLWDPQDIFLAPFEGEIGRDYRSYRFDMLAKNWKIEKTVNHFQPQLHTSGNVDSNESEELEPGALSTGLNVDRDAMSHDTQHFRQIVGFDAMSTVQKFHKVSDDILKTNTFDGARQTIAGHTDLYTIDAAGYLPRKRTNVQNTFAISGRFIPYSAEAASLAHIRQVTNGAPLQMPTALSSSRSRGMVFTPRETSSWQSRAREQHEGGTPLTSRALHYNDRYSRSNDVARHDRGGGVGNDVEQPKQHVMRPRTFGGLQGRHMPNLGSRGAWPTLRPVTYEGQRTKPDVRRGGTQHEILDQTLNSQATNPEMLGQAALAVATEIDVVNFNLHFNSAAPNTTHSSRVQTADSKTPNGGYSHSTNSRLPLHARPPYTARSAHRQLSLDSFRPDMWTHMGDGQSMFMCVKERNRDPIRVGLATPRRHTKARHRSVMHDANALAREMTLSHAQKTLPVIGGEISEILLPSGHLRDGPLARLEDFDNDAVCDGLTLQVKHVYLCA